MDQKLGGFDAWRCSAPSLLHFTWSWSRHAFLPTPGTWRGFSIADRDLKRAGLDYWDKVFLALHADWDAYLAASPGARRWLFTSHAELTHWDVPFTVGDHLVFGSAPGGLPPYILGGGVGTPVAIPMVGGVRSLNLSTAAGIGVYEALRRIRVE